VGASRRRSATVRAAPDQGRLERADPDPHQDAFAGIDALETGAPAFDHDPAQVEPGQVRGPYRDLGGGGADDHILAGHRGSGEGHSHLGPVAGDHPAAFELQGAGLGVDRRRRGAKTAALGGEVGSAYPHRHVEFAVDVLESGVAAQQHLGAGEELDVDRPHPRTRVQEQRPRTLGAEGQALQGQVLATRTALDGGLGAVADDDPHPLPRRGDLETAVLGTEHHRTGMVAGEQGDPERRVGTACGERFLRLRQRPAQLAGNHPQVGVTGSFGQQHQHRPCDEEQRADADHHQADRRATAIGEVREQRMRGGIGLPERGLAEEVGLPDVDVGGTQPGERERHQVVDAVDHRLPGFGPRIGVLREHRAQEVDQAGVDVLVAQRFDVDAFGDLLVHDHRRGLAAVERPPHQRVVDRRREGIHVAAEVDSLVAGRLFGTHVVRGTEGDPAGRGLAGTGRLVLEHPLCEAEVADLGLERQVGVIRGRAEEDVGRLEVAVDDAGAVDRLQGAGHLPQ